MVYLPPWMAEAQTSTGLTHYGCITSVCAITKGPSYRATVLSLCLSVEELFHSLSSERHSAGL